MASRASGTRISMATLRLLRFRLQKTALSPLGCFMFTRDRSPAPDRSILMTSAPKSPRTWVAHGPISVPLSRVTRPAQDCPSDWGSVKAHATPSLLVPTGWRVS
jgi:hypothetical protein